MSPTNAYARAIATMTEDHAHRVWSLLITIFGDLARQPVSELSGGTLGCITREIGIKPEATRVALHRLRKDGWIESRKIGRASAYSLSPFGKEQSEQATPIIYRTVPSTEPVFLKIDTTSREASGTAMPTQPLPAQLTLTTQATGSDFALLVHPAQLPDWIKFSLISSDLKESTDQLLQMLRAVQNVLRKRHDFSATQCAVLRVLLIHSWRRNILKVPDLPDAVFPPDWKGPECRAIVSELLEMLPKPSVQEIEAEALT